MNKSDRDRNGYYDIEGMAYPSSTTIINRVLMKYGLLPWAGRVAAEDLRDRIILPLLKGEFTLDALRALDLDAIIKEAANRHRTIKEEKANRGTRVHQAIDAFLKTGEEPDDFEILPAFEASRQLMKDYNIVVNQAELTVFSHKYRYAGTLDLDCTIQHESLGPNPLLYILDWKTSSGFYPDMPIQLASYVYAIEEMFSKTRDGAGIIRLDSDTGKPEPKFFKRAELEVPFQLFLALRRFVEIEDNERARKAEAKEKIKQEKAEAKAAKKGKKDEKTNPITSD